MTRRTIADAERELNENVAPRLSDYNMKRARQLLDEAKAHATEFARTHLDTIETEVRDTSDDATRELTEVRDGFEDLRREASSGRLSAGEVATRLKELRTRQEQAEAALAGAEEVVVRIETIESDPVAFVDEMATRLPRAGLLRDWPW